MKHHNYGGRVHECLSVLFMVTPVDEADPEIGDFVQVADDEFGQKWFLVTDRIEDDHLEYFIVVPAGWLARLFGGRRVRPNPTH